MVLLLEDPKQVFGHKNFQDYINFRLRHSFFTTLKSIQQNHNDVLKELDADIKQLEFMNKILSMELCPDCPDKENCDRTPNPTCEDVV